MKYSHILWDFNGTLLDDVEAGIESTNVLLAARSLPLIESVEEYRRIFGFPVIDYYKRLGFDFEKEPYEKVAHEWVELYLQNVKKSRLYDGADEALSMLKERGIDQIILSATEKNMLEEQLSSLGIRQYFSDVLGMEDVYAHGKIELGKAWIDKTRPARAALIGDTVHDYEVARGIGVECILVAGGHQSRQKLTACGAMVLENIKEIIKIL